MNPSTQNVKPVRVERAILPGGEGAHMAMPRLCLYCDGQLFASDVHIRDHHIAVICRHCGKGDLTIELRS